MKLMANLILALNFLAVLQNISYGQQFSPQKLQNKVDSVGLMEQSKLFLSDRAIFLLKRC